MLGWVSLRLRRVQWKDVGWQVPTRPSSMLAVGLLAGLAFSAIELFLTQPLIVHFTGRMPDLSDFESIRGQLVMLIVYLLLVWILAAFGEELVYRGYLMNRIADLMRNGRTGWVVSLIVVSVVFGCSHIDQGISGILENVWNGLLLGGLYLACGRNLFAPIVAHGVADTIDLVLIYAGAYPGLQ